MITVGIATMKRINLKGLSPEYTCPIILIDKNYSYQYLQYNDGWKTDIVDIERLPNILFSKFFIFRDDQLEEAKDKFDKLCLSFKRNNKENGNGRE